MKGIARLVSEYEKYGVRAVGVFPAGTFPQVPINDKKMYPIYAKCVELGIPVFCCVGIPGPRLRAACQHVELIDEVMFDFPDLVFVTRHGCEPWTELAVKLMLKWPNLYYSTSAFAPKYYPADIVNYANTRGADRVIYAGYFPMGLSLERIAKELPLVGFKDEVWPNLTDKRTTRTGDDLMTATTTSSDIDYGVFDADNHYYEATDAYTCHIDPAFAKRTMQWAEIDGRRRLLVGGKVNRFIPNPLFDPVAKPGSLGEYFRGRNPGAQDIKALFGDLEPIRPEYRDRDARLRHGRAGTRRVPPGPDAWRRHGGVAGR